MAGSTRERQKPLREPVKVDGRGLVRKALLGSATLLTALLVAWATGLGPFLWELFSDKERIQRAVDGAGVWAPLAYLGFVVAQAVVAPLPAPAVAVVGGYTFGMAEGFVLTWLGSLMGGVMSFGISRLFGRRFVAASERAKRLDRYVDEHGAVVVFVLRLIPLVSFDAISYAAGLSSLRFRSFLLATALGMVPGTFAFVYLGSARFGVGGWGVLLGLAALASAAYLYQRHALRVRRRVR